MLSHQHRFHGHGSLRYVYSHGKRVRSREFGLHFSNNPKRTHSRFAIVVSKKVFKSAVKRNRVRRRLYEIVRNELEHINAVYDIVITVYSPDVLAMPHEELKKLLRNLLAKEKLIS